jgi:hypothetical protein
MDRRYTLIATGPGGMLIELPISETGLRTMIRDSIYTGVRASQEIEGEDPGPYNPPPIESVPERLLETRG